METRRLGRTGHHSSVAILGGAAFWDTTEEIAAAALERALDRGVNHLDIAPSYGRAEATIGPHVARVRQRLFISEKSQRKNAHGVRAQFEESLERLGCDHFDLYQLHAVTSVAELDTRAGAMEAIMAARDEGLCSFVGVTGHDMTAPAAHLEAIRRYDVDTVMFPVYPRLWADATYRSDAERLLEVCTERDVGVMVIKAVAHRPWPNRTRRQDGPWYEPQTDPERIRRQVAFALSTPGVTALCTPGDVTILDPVLDAASAFEPMGRDAREELIASMAGTEVIFPILEKAAPPPN